MKHARPVLLGCGEDDVPEGKVVKNRLHLCVRVARRSVLSPAAWTAPLKPIAWRVPMRELRDPDAKPFRVRGCPITGLPAEFLIPPGGTVRAAKYGNHANDQWTVDDLLHAVEATAGGAKLSSRSRD